MLPCTDAMHEQKVGEFTSPRSQSPRGLAIWLRHNRGDARRRKISPRSVPDLFAGHYVPRRNTDGIPVAFLPSPSNKERKGLAAMKMSEKRAKGGTGSDFPWKRNKANIGE